MSNWKKHRALNGDVTINHTDANAWILKENGKWMMFHPIPKNGKDPDPNHMKSFKTLKAAKEAFTPIPICVQNLMTKQNIWIGDDTPFSSRPDTETYWSM